jgi:hypothetical protein
MDRIAFVWPFWQRPASYDELRWSVRSVYQNFQAEGRRVETVIVGDQPVLRRHSFSWYTGRVIPVPRNVSGSGRVGVKDAVGKWMTALADDSLPDTLVWMMDDVYFIKPVTLAELALPRAFGLVSRQRLESQTGGSWWQRAKRETLLALSDAGLPTFDFATHLPHVVDRRRCLEILTRFDAANQMLLWECLYENSVIAESPQPATPFLRIISDAKCLAGTRNATAKATVMVSAGKSWNEAHRTFLYETFAIRSPVEADDPIPPKRLPQQPVTAPPPAPTAPAIHSSRPKVTCVMNAYGKPQAFPCQFNALKKQTTENEIIVWQNTHEATRKDWKRDWFDEAQVAYAGCNRNLGVWSRFAFALNAKTEFVCVFDDDIVPGTKWLQHCLETYARHPGLLGGNGVIFHSLSDYNARTNYGWAFPNRYCTHVDIVGHAWFCRREWLGLFWSELPDLSQPAVAGEDFHFSYMLQKHGIRTLVPQHRKHETERWSCRNPKQGRLFGRADAALSKHPQHSRTIQAGLDLYVKKGFRLIEHDMLTKEAQHDSEDNAAAGS